MKLTVKEQTKTQIVVIFHDADHTIGNMVTSFLQQNKEKVVFAGYEKPHPQVKSISIKMVVVDGFNPFEVLQDAVKNLHSDLTEIGNSINLVF